jgi:hypothetical protein
MEHTYHPGQNYTTTAELFGRRILWVVPDWRIHEGAAILDPTVVQSQGEPIAVWPFRVQRSGRQ